MLVRRECQQSWTKKSLIILENKILHKIYGSKISEEDNTHERRTNAELREIFNEPYIVETLKSRRMSWASHEWRAEAQTIHEITTRKLDKNRPRARPKQR